MADVAEGWWHPNVKDGRVHDHTAVQPQTMHRLCEQVYRRPADGAPVRRPSYENPVEAGRWDLTPVERAAVPMAEVVAALIRATGRMEGRREVVADDLICWGTRLVNAARQESDEEFTDGEMLVLSCTRCGDGPEPAERLLDPVFWAVVAADWLDEWAEDDDPPAASLAAAVGEELRARTQEVPA